MARGNTAKGFLLAALGGISWGLSGVCSQYLFTQYALSADWLTAVRMVLSGVALLLIAFSRERAKMFWIWGVGRDVRWLLAFGLAGLLLCQYTFLAAIKYSNSATAAVLQRLNVVMMAIVMADWNKKPMGRGQVLAVLLAIAGTYLIASKGDFHRMDFSAAGLLFGLLAAAGVVSYTLLSRPIIASWGNLTITGWGMTIGGAVMLLFFRPWHIQGVQLSGKLILLMTCVIILGTVLSFSLFQSGCSIVGSLVGSVLSSVEPIGSVIISVLFLNTTFSWLDLLGFFLILVTIPIMALGKAHEPVG